MTVPVFVVPAEDLRASAVGDVVRLDGPEGRHAATVRRVCPGEPIRLVDGVGRYVDGIVERVVRPSEVDVRVSAAGCDQAPEPRIVVVQAVPKGERGELAVDLLTEVGVDEIIPWSAARCVARWREDRAERGRRRWQDAAFAAAKQARRTRFPVVAPQASTEEVLTRIARAGLALVLHEDAATSIATVVVPAAGEVVVVVGPEGGLTDDERNALVARGARLVRCGPTVLRTSTAGVVAVGALLARSARWLAPAADADAKMAP